MTNEQKIKSMTTEELAKYIYVLGNGTEYCYGHCIYQDEEDCSQHACLEGVRKWLNQNELSDSRQTSGWTLCSDRLPDKMQTYLVYCREWNVFFGEWDRNYVFRLLQYLPDAGIWNIKTPVHVLAWMPIPEPPEVDESRPESEVNQV